MKIKRVIGECAFFPGVFIEETESGQFIATKTLPNQEKLQLAEAGDVETLSAILQDKQKAPEPQKCGGRSSAFPDYCLSLPPWGVVCPSCGGKAYNE